MEGQQQIEAGPEPKSERVVNARLASSSPETAQPRREFADQLDMGERAAPAAPPSLGARPIVDNSTREETVNARGLLTTTMTTSPSELIETDEEGDEVRAARSDLPEGVASSTRSGRELV